MNVVHNFQRLVDRNGDSDLTVGEIRTLLAFVITNERTNSNTKYLEVGCFGGGTIKALKDHTKTAQFTAVDLFEDFITQAENTHVSGTYSKSDVEKFLGDRVNLIKGSSTSMLPTLNETFDLIFIDADHSYQATKKDFELIQRLLAPGGKVGFHNCSAHWDPDWHYVYNAGGGPWAVCQELIQSKDWKLLADVDRLKVFSKV